MRHRFNTSSNLANRIRWLHAGIVRASRSSRVPFLRHSSSVVFPSYCVIGAKMPDGTDDHTNSTRIWTFAKSSGNSLTCQRFLHSSRSCCRSWWNCNDVFIVALTNSPMFTRLEQNVNFSIFVLVYLFFESRSSYWSKTPPMIYGLVLEA